MSKKKSAVVSFQHKFIITLKMYFKLINCDTKNILYFIKTFINYNQVLMINIWVMENIVN